MGRNYPFQPSASVCGSGIGLCPLFNRFVPLEDGELKSAITAYAAGVGFPLSGIYVIDGSKRSSKANAFLPDSENERGSPSLIH